MFHAVQRVGDGPYLSYCIFADIKRKPTGYILRTERSTLLLRNTHGFIIIRDYMFTAGIHMQYIPTDAIKQCFRKKVQRQGTVQSQNYDLYEGVIIMCTATSITKGQHLLTNASCTNISNEGWMEEEE